LFHADGLILDGNIQLQIQIVRHKISLQTPIDLTSMVGEKHKRKQLVKEEPPIQMHKVPPP